MTGWVRIPVRGYCRSDHYALQLRDLWQSPIRLASKTGRTVQRGQKIRVGIAVCRAPASGPVVAVVHIMGIWARTRSRTDDPVNTELRGPSLSLPQQPCIVVGHSDTVGACLKPRGYVSGVVVARVVVTRVVIVRVVVVARVVIAYGVVITCGVVIAHGVVVARVVIANRIVVIVASLRFDAVARFDIAYVALESVASGRHVRVALHERRVHQLAGGSDQQCSRENK